jgi:hypothetical protein
MLSDAAARKPKTTRRPHPYACKEMLMDTLHTMLRALKRERKSQPDQITAFRELLDQIERIGRRPPVRRVSTARRSKPATKRSRKR